MLSEWFAQGTTWVEEIVWLMKNNLNFELAKAKFHYTRVVFPDMGCPKSLADSLPSPRVFKSHLPIKFLPDNIENKAKLIYVTRNPKDLLMSLYTFQKSIVSDEYEGTFEDFFNLFINGQTMYGPWWEHINQYNKLSNVHFINYEDLFEVRLQLNELNR